MREMPQKMELNVRDAMSLAAEFFKTQQFDEAEKIFRAVVQAEPENFDAINGVALCLAQDGRDYNEALTWIDRAFVILRDEMVALTCNRGRALGELGRAHEGLTLFNNLLLSAPSNGIVRYNRGLMLLQLGHLEEAISDFNTVLEQSPSDGKARFGRGFAKLVQGKYLEGFEDYEYRLKDDLQEPDAPLWTGEQPLRGKTILVMGEMGHGDNIMFMRYLPLMQAQGARVVTALPIATRGLAEAAGIETVDDDRTKWPKLDYWVRYMSLARCFRTTAQTVPPPVPLDIEAARTQAKELRVGLVWSGSRKSRYDAYRSVPLQALAPLFDTPKTHFYSLQLDVRETDLPTFNEVAKLGHLTDMSSEIHTFVDTAKIMKSLDLIVTVDTAAAHLAGTLGIPTIVMLTSYRTYWLWIEKQTTSPWYPSIKLVRQPVDGDWASVVAQVREGIRAKTLNR